MSKLSLEGVRVLVGPSYYLERPAVLFDLRVEGDEPHLGETVRRLAGHFSSLERPEPSNLGELTARLVLEIGKLDLDLLPSAWASVPSDVGHKIAVEYLDPELGLRAARLAVEALDCAARNAPVDIERQWRELMEYFDGSLYGGPTIYSLLEAGARLGIPRFYLPAEDTFQWGYGRSQVRGVSTSFHIDSLRDTEFTCYKDQVKQFLHRMGFPTPRGAVCNGLDEAVEAASDIGYPVVAKPVVGHKGHGVTTGISSREELRHVVRRLLGHSGSKPIIVEKHVTGTDHRLLAVGGRFVAALERVPAYVVGDGSRTIQMLIDEENARDIRTDTARSPLAKINIDEDLKDHLRSSGLRLDTIPPRDETVYLRRVANISAGGVSRNVTDRMHPVNAKLVEDLAGYFGLTCLGIDVLAEDISRPWRDSPFSIIEINAAPGVFMHLSPAEGESIDAPGIIMNTLFPTPRASRVPLVCFNTLEEPLALALMEELAWLIGEEEVVGALRGERVYFDGDQFCCPRDYASGLEMLLRNPRLAAAVVECSSRHLLHEGHLFDVADIVVLDGPDEVEETLARDVISGGWLVLDASQPLREDPMVAHPGLNIAYFCADPDDERRLDGFRGLWSTWNPDREVVEVFLGDRPVDSRRVDDPAAGRNEAILAVVLRLVTRVFEEEHAEAWG
jgi:cyanophycin synthetase